MTWGAARRGLGSASRRKPGTLEAKDLSPKAAQGLLDGIRRHDLTSFSDTDLKNALLRLQGWPEHLSKDEVLPEVFAIVSEVISRRLGIWRLFDPAFDRTTLPSSFHDRRQESDNAFESSDITTASADHAAKFAGGIPVVWGIHASQLEPTTTRRRTAWMIALSGRLSGWLPARIVYCSEVSHRLHESLGYADDRMLVIPNGFDIDAFVPDPDARAAVREELGVSRETPLVGMVARFDPQKDHENFFKAAALLHAEMPEVEFVLCGPGVSADNAVMRTWMDEFDLAGHCHMLGQRGDIARILAALDVASTASSYGEAFPMVVGEAMSCGVPCVVTDIGDSSMIVGHTGRAVPPRDPRALADAWAAILRQDAASRGRLGDAARERIIERYSLGRVTNLYEDLYRQIET